ncbi:MAG: hypothetical protein ACUVUC_00420 [Thermoguttaceae bacterium]
MTPVFLFCAVVGGTIMLCQLVMSLIGLAGDSLDADMAHDVGHDFGADLHADTSGDFHADAGADIHADAAGVDAHGEHAVEGHGSSWLFAVISFRTVVAAMAFFGLAGLAAQSAEVPPATTLLVAAAAGMAAMYGVYWMMQLLYRMKSEGTVRIQHAIGREGTVYLRIPAGRSGAGKVHLNLQNRTMEYAAMTSGPELPTGARVVVVDLISPDTLEVQAVAETERS